MEKGGSGMNHLPVDQVIEFVSIEELNEETIGLAVSVNAHICKCGKCLKTVKAFQNLHNAFEKLQFGDFASYVQEQECQEQLENLDFGD